MSAQLPLALQLREGNNLSNFLSGPNGAALAGVREVVLGADRQAFIWGGEQQGKSHLLEGAVRLAQQQGMDACLLPASELLPLVPAVLEAMEQFDLLALDDCQRFAAGPVYRLGPLEDGDMQKVLQERAKARGLRIEQDVAHYIVLRSERSPGALMALLDRLDRMALAQQRSVTIPFVKDALGW